jgi:hypothetical protein
MPVMTHATLIPAYGRDYKSKKDVLAALNVGADFVLRSYNAPDTYINAQGLRELGVRELNVRYGNLRKVCVLRMGSDVKPWA